MFEITFHRRSSYVFRANKNFEGFFIRKRNWHQIGEDFPEHFEYLTKKAFMDHVVCLSRQMQKFRADELNKYNKRSDYHSVMVVNDLLAD